MASRKLSETPPGSELLHICTQRRSIYNTEFSGFCGFPIRAAEVLVVMVFKSKSCQ